MIYKTKFRSLESLSDSDEEIHANIDTKSYRKFIKEERKRRLNELRSKETLSAEELKELKILEYKELPVVVEIPVDTFRFSDDKTYSSSSNIHTKELNDTENIKTDIMEGNDNKDICLKESKTCEEYYENRIIKSESDQAENINKEEDPDSKMIDKLLDDMIEMFNNYTLEYIVDYLSSKPIYLEMLEDQICYNLTEAIKMQDDMHDEYGKIWCGIGLLTTWVIKFGRKHLNQFRRKQEKFDKLVNERYEESKKAILSLYKEEQ